MAKDLVNAFGKITLDETQRDTKELLHEILIELKKLDLHLSELSGLRINEDDVKDLGE